MIGSNRVFLQASNLQQSKASSKQQILISIDIILLFLLVLLYFFYFFYKKNRTVKNFSISKRYLKREKKNIGVIENDSPMNHKL